MPAPLKPFTTARTNRWRTTELDPLESSTIDQIEQFGCSVIHVKADASGFGWSYTIGLFDTACATEIVTIGLSKELAHFALNEAATLLRSGTELTRGRHRELIGEVECEFRPVDPKWIKQIMNWTCWYYEGASVPTLQLVYPDLENRFPDEDGFNERFRRPCLQPDEPMTTVECQFWDSTEPGNSQPNWKFSDPPDAIAFLTETVRDGAEQVTYVSHDAEDGAWQFLGDRMMDGGGPVLSCLRHLVDRDPTLEELADLPLGWYAVRDEVGAPWTRWEQPPSDESDEESA